MDGETGATFLFNLNKIAGANGVGRLDMIEDRVVGLKSREVYECPGSITLIDAHIALERLVLTKEELRLKAQLDQRYTELIYDGQWSSPLRDALDAFNAKIAERMTGEVRVKLVRGRAVVTGSRSPFALYSESLATYGNERYVQARRGRRASSRSGACRSRPVRRKRPKPRERSTLVTS